MSTQLLREIIGDVSREAIKQWLKISGFRHTANNEADFYKLLNELITKGDLRIERLRRLVLEIEEYRAKRIYLGKLINSKTIGLRQKFENHLNSIGLRLAPEPVKAKELPSRPHLNYICWSQKEVRIGYSETHEFRKVSFANDTIKWESETNLITISAEPSTGFIKIMMDSPGEKNIHKVGYGTKNIDNYVNFYKKKAVELLGASEFKSIDLLKVSEGIVKARPKIFAPTDFHKLSSFHSSYRIKSRSDVTDDPVFTASEKADGEGQVHEGVSGYWLPEASEGQLQRRLFMQLSRREDMIRFDAE
ncbi:MAG TPA: hypothetical protein VE732_09565, partial [Nitrososphaera sp.]|nr:hypothetical protein [Nitrososphaera sp.]